MAWYDFLDSGVYIDQEGNTWERRGKGEGHWYVNGALWTPFPRSLRLLDDGFVQEHLGRRETLQETKIRLERATSRDPDWEWNDDKEA